MMTKKHYVAVARIIKANIDAARMDSDLQSIKRIGMIAVQLSDFMARDNPKFNMDRFIEAATGPTF